MDSESKVWALFIIAVSLVLCTLIICITYHSTHTVSASGHFSNSYPEVQK